MSETIKVLCYKYKTLSNGENPLMLCVCKDRKRSYQSLGSSRKYRYHSGYLLHFGQMPLII
ncbi:Arm DNA-binding domain-containing protein [Bacteroides sp. AN502(2024)]|uniref:Arm DNA-binding domain-containing protein n=1 Tax=Bacteroides sp. AN502(2024) TaxID=3160599 RepID=UPI003516294A